MKNIFKIKLIPFLILLFLLGGCTKFLKEKPYSFLTGDNFPTTANEADIALRSVYGVMQSYYDPEDGEYGGYGFNMFNYRFAHVVNEVCDLQQPYYIAPNQSRSSSRYSAPFACFFKGINFANNLIAALEKRDANVDTWVTAKIAEAKAARAYYYFWLVRMFSDVPLLLEPTTSGTFKGDRTPVPDIYKQIVEDLKFAEDKLPNIANADGRITMGGCKAILAEVYSVMAGWRRTPEGQNVQGDPSYWPLARDKAKEVLDMGTYAFASDYTQIFKDLALDVYNPEMIFDIPFTYNGSNDIGSTFPYAYGPESETGADPVGGGKNGGPNVLIEWLRELEPNDLRIDWNIAKYYYKSKSWVKVNYSDSSEWIVAKYRKWPENDDSHGFYWGNWLYNFPLIRLAEMKLLYAEAANQSNNGPTPEAYNQINEIRRRAGLADLPMGLTKDQFHAHIMTERSIEFLAEGKRHFDLVRWGNFKEMMDKRLSAFWVTNYGGVDEVYINYPLPPEELDLNKWTQNK